MSSDCTWEYLILRSHAEAILSDKTCRSTWKWSNEQDDWQHTQFVSIADWASTHWSDNKINIHTETDQINMKSSLKREIQRSSFSIFDIKDDTSTSATAQKSCKVSQRVTDAAMHKKIDFNQFLHERRVLDVTMMTCKCNRDQMLIKHILLTCSKWKIEQKMMHCEENITNLRKLLEIMSVTTAIIQMILSTSILNQFQTVMSLKSQMKERESRKETSS